MAAEHDIAPVKIVMFTDAGTDLDDEMAMLFARYLIEFNFIELLGVISCLHPSFKRGQLARGTLDMIGLHGVPVAFGTDGGDGGGRNVAPDPGEFPYMPSDGSERAFSLESGRALFYRILAAAAPKSVHVCAIASLKDAALFLRDNETLFSDRVAEVSIMGGVKAAAPDAGGLLEPDTAHNNEFDRAAAVFFYRRCQELGVRLVVVGRDAAYAVPIGRSVYDDLALIGSPIGWRLRNAQRSSIEALWRRAAAEGDDARFGLPARCDAAWFRRTFCGGDARVDGRTAADPIWDLVTTFNMYDTLALVAAVPLLRDSVFAPDSFFAARTRTPSPPPLHRPAFPPAARGTAPVEHLLVGAVAGGGDGFASAEARTECSLLLREAYKTGLALDHHSKAQIILAMQVKPKTQADEFMGLALLRSLIELQAVDLLGVVLASEERFGALAPLEAAADATRATLNALGLHNTDILVQHASKRACQLEALYEKAPQAGLRLVVIHSSTDVAAFVSRCPDLFFEKTLGVVVMGGVAPAGVLGDPAADGSRTCESLEIDADASNNRADEAAAAFFARTCQALGVPMTVISRHLALACRLPRAVYDALGKRGGPVGEAVCRAQRASIELLWKRVNLPPGHPGRPRELRDECDAAWFGSTFCENGAPPRGDGAVWDAVASFNVYTSLALLAAVPRIGTHFYDTATWVVRGTHHGVIGASSSDPGTKNVAELRLFLCRLILKGVLMNASHFPDAEHGHVNIENVGLIALDDEVPEYIDLCHERARAKQETVNKTILEKIRRLKRVVRRPSTS